MFNVNLFDELAIYLFFTKDSIINIYGAGLGYS